MTPEKAEEGFNKLVVSSIHECATKAKADVERGGRDDNRAAVHALNTLTKYAMFAPEAFEGVNVGSEETKRKLLGLYEKAMETGDDDSEEEEEEGAAASDGGGGNNKGFAKALALLEAVLKA